jgi:hypothetical protein
MVRLAKFQIKHLKVFTGFFVPYLHQKDKAKIERAKAKQKREDRKLRQLKIPVQIAVLGGGDVAFPLIFAGTILISYGLAYALITILLTTIALALLLLFSKKGEFYPAMPFLTGGCLAGLLIAIL